MNWHGTFTSFTVLFFRNQNYAVTIGSSFCSFHTAMQHTGLMSAVTDSYDIVMCSLQLENVGAVALQFSCQVVMENLIDVKTAAMRNVMSDESRRPATAGPLMIRLDDTSSVRPSSAITGVVHHYSVLCLGTDSVFKHGLKTNPVEGQM